MQVQLWSNAHIGTSIIVKLTHRLYQKIICVINPPSKRKQFKIPLARAAHWQRKQVRLNLCKYHVLSTFTFPHLYVDCYVIVIITLFTSSRVTELAKLDQQRKPMEVDVDRLLEVAEAHIFFYMFRSICCMHCD